MLTLYYVAASWLQSWRLSSSLAKIKEIRSKKGSIVLHQEVAPYIYVVPSGCAAESKMEVNGVLSKSCSNHSMSNIKDLVWFSGNKKILSIYPEQELEVSQWIRVIPGRTQLPIELDSLCSRQVSLSQRGRLFILVEASYNTPQCTSPRRTPLKVERYGVAVAWHVGEQVKLLVETDEARLAALCVLFMHNDLTLDNALTVVRILSVNAHGCPYSISNTEAVPETYAAPLSSELSGKERREALSDRWRCHVSMMATFCEAVHQVYETNDEISVRHPGSGVGAVRLVPGERVSPGAGEADGETLLEESDEAESDVTDCYPGSETNTQRTENPTAVYCQSSTVSSLREDTISTDTVIPPDSTRESVDMSVETCLSSLRSLPVTPLRSTVSTSLGSTLSAKPPNILVYSESSSTADAVRSALLSTLAINKYTVDKVSWSRLVDGKAQCRLMVVHGDVPSAGPLLHKLTSNPGSAALVLCSDLLRTVLPLFRTAEVRPNELVRCSYKSWKHVPLVHHVFVYQPSVSHNTFSQDQHSRGLGDWVELSEEGSTFKERVSVEVLATEETWNTPSLLQLTFTASRSTIVFSQVHLELEPSGEEEAERGEALRQSDRARLEMLCDVLSTHLGLDATLKRPSVPFTPAYFLGNHERKQMLVNELMERGDINDSNCLECGGESSPLTVKLCGKGATAPPATANYLPLLLHSCPHAFSTVQYFEELKSEFIGRLVVFSEVLRSSMDLVKGPPLHHGLAVIPLRQTHGTGRGGNSWLSPEGSGMFTLQLHVPLSSYLGKHLSLVQHLTGLAVVSAVSSLPGLRELDIGLKWPNDIYVNKTIKIGGIVTTSTVNQNCAVCNVGCGVNVSNREPTVCLNDVIAAHCKATGRPLQTLTLEKYFACVFNKMEELYDLAQSNHIDDIYRLYYDFWLHSDAEVKVRGENGDETEVTLRGIDEFGFLVGETRQGSRVTLQPDGNSFDMMAGLIVSKSSW